MYTELKSVDLPVVLPYCGSYHLSDFILHLEIWNNHAESFRSTTNLTDTRSKVHPFVQYQSTLAILKALRSSAMQKPAELCLPQNSPNL